MEIFGNEKSRNFFIILLIFLLGYQTYRIRKLNDWPIEWQVGDEIPAFAAKDLNNHNHDVRKALFNYLIIFLNPDCRSCELSVPYLNQAYIELRKRGIKVISVCRASKEVALSFAKKTNSTFPIIPDQEGEIFHKCKITYTPVIILLNKEKKITYI